MSDSADTRVLGFFSLLALGLNGIIGVGIFFAPSEVGGLVPGRAGIWVYALTALALLPVAAAYAILGSRFDEDGGPYVWARAAFGPTAGFAVGWVAYVSALFSTSAVVSGLSLHAGPLLGFSSEVMQRVFAALSVLVLSLVAASGLEPSARVWSGVTILKLLPLLLLVALFFLSGAAPPALPGPRGGSFARAALVVVFATQGFEIVPVPAGNARRGARSVPAATVLSLALAALLYVVLHAACVAAVPDLAGSRAPLVDAATALGGGRAGAIVALGTNVSALGIAFGMFAMSPRYLAALGRADGLGPWVAREDRRRVPQRALWLTSAFVLVAVVSGKLMELFALSSVAVLTQYAVSISALTVLAVRGQRGLALRHLWPAPLALVVVGLVAWAAKPAELVVGAAVLGVGAVLLALRRHRR